MVLVRGRQGCRLSVRIFEKNVKFTKERENVFALDNIYHALIPK